MGVPVPVPVPVAIVRLRRAFTRGFTREPCASAHAQQVGESDSKFEDLVRYLTMARETLKERVIDTELVYSLAQTNLADLETLITSPNVAEIQAVGDRCFDESMFEAARILFQNIGNNAKLASTLLHLTLYREAVEAAKKANSVRCVRCESIDRCAIIPSPSALHASAPVACLPFGV